MSKISLLSFALLCSSLVAMEMEQPAKRIKASTDTQNTTLHEAIKKNDNALVQQLIMEGANVNARESSENGKTPLFLALDNLYKARAYLLEKQGSEKAMEIVQLLLQAGADANEALVYKDTTLWENGKTPLMIATIQRETSTVKLLLTYGADPLIKDSVCKKTVVDFLRDILALPLGVVEYSNLAYIFWILTGSTYMKS